MALQEVISAHERSLLTSSSDFWSLDGDFSDDFLNTWYCDWDRGGDDLQCLICVSDQEEDGSGWGTSSKPRTLVCTRQISYRRFVFSEGEPVYTDDIYDTIEITIYYQSGSSYAGTRSMEEANISEFTVHRRTDNSEASCVAVIFNDGNKREEVHGCDLCRDDIGAWAIGLRKIARKGGTLSDYDIAVDRPEDGYWQPSLSGVPKTCPLRPGYMFFFLGGHDFANQYKITTVAALLLASLVFVVPCLSFQRRHRWQRVPENDPEGASDTELVRQPNIS